MNKIIMYIKDKSQAIQGFQLCIVNTVKVTKLNNKDQSSDHP